MKFSIEHIYYQINEKTGQKTIRYYITKKLADILIDYKENFDKFNLYLQQKITLKLAANWLKNILWKKSQLQP